MIRSFLSVVSVAVFAPAVGAQYQPLGVPQSCPGGVCRPVQAAVQTVRSATANVIQVAGNVVYAGADTVRGPVYGTWAQPVQPWYSPLPATVPQPMPQAQPMVSGRMAGHAASMAASGRMYHSGRFQAGATHEGVGYSTRSADDAVRHCCYWGQRTPVSIDVRRGAGGWFAVVQYR